MKQPAEKKEKFDLFIREVDKRLSSTPPVKFTVEPR